MGRLDEAGRTIAGLLTYNPGPGIYSRLERAIEAMPENVRVQELPGLLKRYKEGVPGWELKETDLDSVIAGRDVVPREELLARVKERSPVYTHGEVILGGRPQIQHVPTGGTAYRYDADTDTSVRLPDDTRPEPDYQFPDTGDVSRLGRGVSHGPPRYEQYGQGGQEYTELLLTQPGAERLLAPPHAGTDPEFQVAPRVNYGSHWSDDTKDAVVHARFDTHGDALRINELQSDLGIHNRKAREYAAQNPQTAIVDGQHVVQNDPAAQGLPFPLEDAWADLLIKRLALEAARKGHRAIEVASPRAIADKVGGNIDNYEHFYGKVVPGALERLGRKMGGLVEDAAAASQEPVPGGYGPHRSRAVSLAEDLLADAGAYADGLVGGRQGTYTHGYGVEKLADAIRRGGNTQSAADELYQNMIEHAVYKGWPEQAARTLVGGQMPKLMRMADDLANAEASRAALRNLETFHGVPDTPSAPPGRRYLMSDEMRRRLIEQGVGASLLAPLLGAGVDSLSGDRD